MNDRPQLNVRLDPHLHHQFQEKLKQGGWSCSRIVARLIKTFIEAPDGFLTAPLNHPQLPVSLITALSEDVDRLSQKFQYLELYFQGVEQKLESLEKRCQGLDKRFQEIEEQLSDQRALIQILSDSDSRIPLKIQQQDRYPA